MKPNGERTLVVVGARSNRSRSNSYFAETSVELVEVAVPLAHSPSEGLLRLRGKGAEGGWVPVDGRGTERPVTWWRRARSAEVDVEVVGGNIGNAKGGVDVLVCNGVVHVRLVAGLDPFSQGCLFVSGDWGRGGIRGGRPQRLGALRKPGNIEGHLETQVVLGGQVA